MLFSFLLFSSFQDLNKINYNKNEYLQHDVNGMQEMNTVNDEFYKVLFFNGINIYSQQLVYFNDIPFRNAIDTLIMACIYTMSMLETIHGVGRWSSILETMHGVPSHVIENALSLPWPTNPLSFSPFRFSSSILDFATPFFFFYLFSCVVRPVGFLETRLSYSWLD